MSSIPHIRRRLGVPAGRNQQLPPSNPTGTWGAGNTGANVCPEADPASFWRIVPVPFGAWVAALESGQLTSHDSELRLGRSVLRGPIERDQHFGTLRVEVRLARGPLRPRLRMRLHVDHWSATSTVLELIPCQRLMPSAAYFRAGRGLLDSLAHTLPQHMPVHQQAGAAARVPQDALHAATAQVG